MTRIFILENLQQQLCRRGTEEQRTAQHLRSGCAVLCSSVPLRQSCYCSSRSALGQYSTQLSTQVFGKGMRAPSDISALASSHELYWYSFVPFTTLIGTFIPSFTLSALMIAPSIKLFPLPVMSPPTSTRPFQLNVAPLPVSRLPVTISTPRPLLKPEVPASPMNLITG